MNKEISMEELNMAVGGSSSVSDVLRELNAINQAAGGSTGTGSDPRLEALEKKKSSLETTLASDAALYDEASRILSAINDSLIGFTQAAR